MTDYEDLLIKTVLKSEPIRKVLQTLKDLNPPFEYYVGAGCIADTVWNDISSFPLEYGISDIDIVYYDVSDTSEASESKLKEKIENKLPDITFDFDVKNQARVHLWYEQKFGFPIEPYPSLEAAIDSWPTTANALGIRIEQNNTYTIYAPYALDDLFSMIIRPNKSLVTKEIFEKKAYKWKERWPKLEIIAW